MGRSPSSGVTLSPGHFWCLLLPCGRHPPSLLDAAFDRSGGGARWLRTAMSVTDAPAQGAVAVGRSTSVWLRRQADGGRPECANCPGTIRQGASVHRHSSRPQGLSTAPGRSWICRTRVCDHLLERTPPTTSTGAFMEHHAMTCETWTRLRVGQALGMYSPLGDVCRQTIGNDHFSRRHEDVHTVWL